jgi:hypothetical protein
MTCTPKLAPRFPLLFMTFSAWKATDLNTDLWLEISAHLSIEDAIFLTQVHPSKQSTISPLMKLLEGLSHISRLRPPADILDWNPANCKEEISTNSACSQWKHILTGSGAACCMCTAHRALGEKLVFALTHCGQARSNSQTSFKFSFYPANCRHSPCA